MCVYIYIHTHTYIYIHVYAYIRAHAHTCESHTHYMCTQVVIDMSGRLSVEQQIIMYMVAMVLGLVFICPCIKPFILMADRRLHASREVRVCTCVFVHVCIGMCRGLSMYASCSCFIYIRICMCSAHTALWKKRFMRRHSTSRTLLMCLNISKEHTWCCTTFRRRMTQALLLHGHSNVQYYTRSCHACHVCTLYT